MPASLEPRPRIVVVGAGFGGLNVVKTLAPAAADIVLIDQTNHNLFQPLLYQVATAALAPSDIAVPIRSIFRRHRNVEVLMGEVNGVDTSAHTLDVRGVGQVRYDTLILATGSVYSWFGHDDWAAHSASLKSLEDAETMRRHILSAFEEAEDRTGSADVRGLTTFVIVGGGPTGVELAGAVAELTRSTLAQDYRRIDPTTARVVLCEAGPRLLASFPQHLSDYALHRLRQLGVEVRTGTTVQAVRSDGITADGDSIPARNVFWCAGTAATPAAQWVGAETGRHGLIKVNADCSVPGHPDIFAIGDVAEMQGPEGHPLPALAPVAKQQGRYVGRLLRHRIERRPPPPAFHYRDYGQLAVLGRSAAVADFGFVRLRGVLAWILWSAVHLFLLLGARNRLAVYINWVWAWLTYGRGARLITGSRADARETAAKSSQAPSLGT